MGKTLQRQKKKLAAQNAAAHNTAQPDITKGTKKGKGGNKEGELVTRISDAFNKYEWDGALKGLEELRRSGIVPKLGAVQRWTRMADLVGEEKLCAKLLAAIIRTIPASGGPMPMAPLPSGTSREAVRKHPPFQPPLSPQQRIWLAAETAQPPQQTQPTSQTPNHPTADAEGGAAAGTEQQEGSDSGAVVVRGGGPGSSGSSGFTGTGSITPGSYEGAFTTVPQDPASQPAKRPPNWHELKIWVAKPGTIRFGPDPEVVRVELPFIPGACVLTGVLSPAECRQLVAASESIGYRWDVDYSFNPSAPGSAAAAQPGAPPPAAPPPPKPAGGSTGSQGTHPLLSAARAVAGGDRAAGCVWFADDSIMAPIWRRAAPHLPQVLCGGQLAGVNARFRFYRYDQTNVYRPHVDGAWPGSGIVDGKLVHDAFGDRWSRLTFLVYLNDDFEGGHTTFFTPSPDDPSCLDARGIKPRAGNIAIFPHGDTTGSLVHEGSTVTRGSKYVIRTEVLYKAAGPPGYGTKGASGRGGAGARAK